MKGMNLEEMKYGWQCKDPVRVDEFQVVFVSISDNIWRSASSFNSLLLDRGLSKGHRSFSASSYDRRARLGALSKFRGS